MTESKFNIYREGSLVKHFGICETGFGVFLLMLRSAIIKKHGDNYFSLENIYGGASLVYDNEGDEISIFDNPEVETVKFNVKEKEFDILMYRADERDDIVASIKKEWEKQNG